MKDEVRGRRHKKVISIMILKRKNCVVWHFITVCKGKSEETIVDIYRCCKSCTSVFSYPVHVKGEEDLVHIAAGLLCHTVHFKHSLELKERNEP